jgi:hypothetical protein
VEEPLVVVEPHSSLFVSLCKFNKIECMVYLKCVCFVVCKLYIPKT